MLLMLTFSSAAFAGLSAVGPVNPMSTNGFPTWYTDANGVTVELPIPPLGNGVTAPTMIYGPLTPASNLVAQRAGFDTEAFYFIARSPKAFQTRFGKAVVTLGLEASYVSGIPTDGDQMVFARIRINAAVQNAGTYTFFHPWGSETITVTQADITNKTGLRFTKDIGLTPGWVSNGAGGWTQVAAPLGFYSVLQAGNTMSTFLRAVAPAPPAGWIGDGVTEATFTGSPIAYNKIRLQGPAGIDLDGRGNNFVEATTMVISGHIPTTLTAPLPLSLDRVTCSFIGTTEHINVFLTTAAGATVSIADAATGAILYSGNVTSPSGKFFADFLGTSTAVKVSVSAPGFTTTTATANVLDYINITSCNYSLGTGTLTVTATSSDFFTAAQKGRLAASLTVAGFGPMTVDATGTYTLGPVALTAPLPPTITVNSSVGGSDTTSVAIAP
jgi:hypothetical protein